jgi:hypothetical protein
MLTQDQIQALRSPFPPEALSADTSRGFELTSIKAAYVIERLNEVFGLCGTGWRYAHSPFEEVHTDTRRVEIVTEVAFQYRFPATTDGIGCAPITWDAQASGWAFRGETGVWNEPILACGGKSVGKGGAAVTDARKSAVTDGLTKAASMIGVGHDVFKGLVRVGGNRRDGVNSRKQQPDSTAFWALYRAEGAAADIPIETAKALAGKGNWVAACAELRAMIAKVAVCCCKRFLARWTGPTPP